MMIRNTFIISLLLLLASATNGYSSNTAIICLGASLTEGEGADKGHDYPTDLSKMLNMPVINAGVNGDTTEDELDRMQGDVLQNNPRMVIITQRANDLKLGIPKQETLNNLESMIDQIQARGAIAVLVTFEPKELQETYFKDVREMSIRKHAVLVADVLQGVDTNPQYMHDKIHPNNEGYLLVAQRVYKIIKPYLD